MTGEDASPQTLWQLDSTHPEVAARVREGLREIIDPELEMNVIELGLIREISINDNAMHMKMILTTPFCPYAPALLEMTRSKSEVLADTPTTIELGMEPWDPSMMEGGAAAAWGLY
jgi:metal-sulfur cluster biosynthetic enzyme